MEKYAKKRDRYISPKVEMQSYILEKGFAISADTDNNKTQGTGNTPGDNWKEIDAFDWGNNNNYNE